MPKRYFKIIIDNDIEIHVFFETMNGLIVRFVVKLLLIIDAVPYEVARYDSAHSCPHKDILDENGKITRKTWFELLDNKQALDLAIKDFSDNYDFYIGRFKKWLK